MRRSARAAWLALALLLRSGGSPASENTRVDEDGTEGRRFARVRVGMDEAELSRVLEGIDVHREGDRWIFGERPQGTPKVGRTDAVFEVVLAGGKVKRKRKLPGFDVTGEARAAAARPLILYLDDLSTFHGDGYRVFCADDGEVVVLRLARGKGSPDGLSRQRRRLSPPALAALRAQLAEAARVGVVPPSRPFIPDEVPLKLGLLTTEGFELSVILSPELARQPAAIQALVAQARAWAAPTGDAAEVPLEGGVVPWPDGIARPAALTPRR